MFPYCLAASDKHKKPGQMDTDLGQKSRDFLTQDPQGSLLSKEKGSVRSSQPQNRGMTSLTCQLKRLPAGGCQVGPSRYLQIVTPPVLGSKPGPVPKGRARRETPTLGASKKLGVGSRSVGRAPCPRSEGNSWMWIVRESSHNPHRGLYKHRLTHPHAHPFTLAYPVIWTHTLKHKPSHTSTYLDTHKHSGTQHTDI